MSVETHYKNVTISRRCLEGMADRFEPEKSGTDWNCRLSFSIVSENFFFLFCTVIESKYTCWIFLTHFNTHTRISPEVHIRTYSRQQFENCPDFCSVYTKCCSYFFTSNLSCSWGWRKKSAWLPMLFCAEGICLYLHICYICAVELKLCCCRNIGLIFVDVISVDVRWNHT